MPARALAASSADASLKQPGATQLAHWGGVFAMTLCMLMSAVGQADAAKAPGATVSTASAAAASAKPKELRVWMMANESRFAVSLADTEAARAFAARLPLTLDMSDLNDNEKKFDLSTPLPANPSRPGTIRSGDLMLYGSHTIVLFYMTFDSPYAYTRLGRVDDASGLTQALGKRNVLVTFSLQ